MPAARVATVATLATTVLSAGMLQPAWADATLEAAGGGTLREASFETQVSVTGTIARVRTRQVLVNRGPDTQTAIYTFEVPDNAAVIDVKVRMPSGRTTTAEIVDAEAATHVAPGTTGLRKRGAAPDAALLRLIERDSSRDPSTPGRATYELRAHPVPPRGTTLVEMTWLAPMRLDDSRLSLRVPGRGNASNLVTTRVGIKLSPGQGVRGYDQLFAGGRLLARKVGGKTYSTLAPRHGDLVVEAVPRVPGGTAPRLSFAAVPIGKNVGAVVVQGWSPRATGKAPLDHDRVILVVDTSQSMGTAGVRAAADMAAALLAVVPAEARIDLITYHRTATPLFGKLRANTSDNRKRIAAAIAPLPGLSNGSDLGAALDLVQKAVDRDESRVGGGSTLVAIFSDGMVPLELTGRRAADRVGQRVLLDGQVLAVTLVPEGAPAPDTAEGPLAELANRTGGRAIAVRHAEAASRAGDLAAELAKPAPLERLTLDAGATRIEDAALPKRLDPARGFFSVGLYRGPLPKRVSLTATRKGRKVVIAGNRDKALTRVALPLALVGLVPIDLADTGREDMADDDDEVWGESRETTELMRASRKARVVTSSTALVAVDASDSFARDRLAMTRKWGPRVFMRLPSARESYGGQIQTSYNERSGRPSSGAGSSGPRATGTLDRAIIKRLIHTHVVPKARACYERQLKRNPNLAGALILYLELARGEVQWAEVRRSSFPSTGIEACVANAGYSIRVPRVALGDDAESVGVVTYPLSFRRTNNQTQVGIDNKVPPVVVDPNAPL